MAVDTHGPGATAPLGYRDPRCFGAPATAAELAPHAAGRYGHPVVPRRRIGRWPGMAGSLCPNGNCPVIWLGRRRRVVCDSHLEALPYLVYGGGATTSHLVAVGSGKTSPAIQVLMANRVSGPGGGVHRPSDIDASSMVLSA